MFYYAPTFILFELSSPFLNIHWFLDKLNMTGSNAQLFNGILLMSTFAGSRLIWGSYNCFRVFPDLWKAVHYQSTDDGKMYLAARASHKVGVAAIEETKRTSHRHVPVWLAGIYVLSYITLMALNFVWFGKMVETIRRRFDPPFGTRGTGQGGKSRENVIEENDANGRDVEIKTRVNANGSTATEIQETEVKGRRTRRKPD